MRSLVFKKQAEKYYRKSPIDVKRRLNTIFDRLASGDFRKLDIKPLKGEFNGIFRIRVGNLRIFIGFEKSDIINVLLISPRGDAY